MLTKIQAVNYLPGYRIPFWPLCLPGAVLPTTWWNVGMAFPWLRRFDGTSLYLSVRSSLPVVCTNAPWNSISAVQQ